MFKLSRNIFFKNKLCKQKYSKNILKVKKEFLQLKKDYKENKIPLLSTFERNYEFSYSKKFVKTLKHFNNIILVGMGGSILGSRAIYSFLKKKIKKKFYFLDNLSEMNISKINNLKITKPVYIFISKSGNTLETISNFSLIFKKKSKNCKKVFITEKKNSAIYEIAQKLKSQIIEHKDFIGGRYSVMSEAGMLPAELMNLKVKRFKNLNYLINNKNFVQELISNVYCLHTLYKNNKSNFIILNYDPSMNDLSFWYQQLISESLGKKGKGFMPIISFAPKDHHSLLQLYLDGPRNNFFTIFSSKHETNYRLSNFMFPESIKFIAKKKLETIIDAQRISVENVFSKKKIPFRTFYFSMKREEELGFIFTFFVLETILLSKLIKVNPFDQPAVELIKKDTKRILLKN